MTSWNGPDYPSSLTLLIDRLEEIPSLRDPASRRLCLDLLVDRLGVRLVVEDLPTTRAVLIGIVQACRRQHPRAVHAFLDAVEQLEPGSTPVRRARAAVEDMTALELVADNDRSELLTLLGGGPDDMLGEFVRSAAGPAAALIAEERYPADALATLERMNARPDGVPPLLVFVELLATYFGGERADRLRQWNDRQAERAGLTAGLHAVRREQVAATPPQEVVAYLVVRVEADLLDADRLTVTHWRQNHPTEWCPRRGDSVSGDLDAVRAHVAELVAEAESGWARKAVTIQIEFLLPYNLLNLPVDQWDLEAGSGLPRPLGLHYLVVLRSLDRARSPRWHREWRRRWEKLKATAGLQGFEEQWLWSDGAKPRQLSALDAKLAVRKDVVSLVLRGMPVGGNPGEVIVGVRTGVPVMVWHRSDAGRAAFESEIKAMAREAFPELAERLRLLRSQARQVSRPGSHVGSRVSLLWDDPERPVEPPEPPAAPHEEVPAS